MGYNGYMELLEAIDNPTDAVYNYPKLRGESGEPQPLTDNTQQIAELLGRQNASYEKVWETAESVYPLWQPVKCNSYRRALLLASSATQHRTKAFEVRRRGRLVFIRLVPEQMDQASGQ